MSRFPWPPFADIEHIFGRISSFDGLGLPTCSGKEADWASLIFSTSRRPARHSKCSDICTHTCRHILTNIALQGPHVTCIVQIHLFRALCVAPLVRPRVVSACLTLTLTHVSRLRGARRFQVFGGFRVLHSKGLLLMLFSCSEASGTI